jgi:hypothetical protein
MPNGRREKPYSKSVVRAPDEAVFHALSRYDSNPYSASHAGAREVSTPKAPNEYCEGHYSKARDDVEGAALVASESYTSQNTNLKTTASEDTATYVAPPGYQQKGSYSNYQALAGYQAKPCSTDRLPPSPPERTARLSTARFLFRPPSSSRTQKTASFHQQTASPSSVSRLPSAEFLLESSYFNSSRIPGTALFCQQTASRCSTSKLPVAW